MKKTWQLTHKILSGEKTVETRWYKTKRAPWGKVRAGEKIYFKDSGGPVTVVAEVAKVDQYEDVDEKMRRDILALYGPHDLGTLDITDEIECYTKGKCYCIAVHLRHPRKVSQFEIDKQGYGAMSAWLCVEEEELAGIQKNLRDECTDGSC